MDPVAIVLGLGNPGARYRATRHNLGFRVVDRLAERRSVRLRAAGELGESALWAEHAGAGGPLVLAKPRLYMNRSGRAAVALCRRYAVSPQQLLVVYDDADLELGRLRVRQTGRAGGHNGVRSIIDALGSEDFPRLKLGVRGAGRQEQELADYVLESFADDEREVVDALVGLAVEAVEEILAAGVTAAMNRYNGLRGTADGNSNGS